MGHSSEHDTDSESGLIKEKGANRTLANKHSLDQSRPEMSVDSCIELRESVRRAERWT